MAAQGALVVITGAARGVGAATAQRLHAVGYRLLLLDRAAEVREVAAGLAGSVAYLLDVSDEAAVQAMVAEIVERHGVPDVWVNNAGIGLWGPFDPTRPGSEQAEMTVNYHGSVNCIRALLPHWQRRGRGHLIQVTSSAALVHGPNMASYAASKAAIASFVRALRVEQRPYGITVSEVIPNTIDSAMSRGHNAAHIPKIAQLRPPLTVVQVAAAIQHCIEARPREVRLPGLITPFHWVAMLFPTLWDWLYGWGNERNKDART